MAKAEAKVPQEQRIYSLSTRRYNVLTREPAVKPVFQSAWHIQVMESAVAKAGWCQVYNWYEK